MENIEYAWRCDRIRLELRGAASAPDITEYRQPLGPASAPRGIQAQEISNMVESRKQSRRDLATLQTECKNYPNMGISQSELQPLLTSAGNDISFVVDHLRRLGRHCQFFDSIASGADLANSNQRLCDRGGCEMYYLDQSTTPPELRRDYFPMDYIQQNKDLLRPQEIMSALGNKYKNELAVYFGGGGGQGQYGGGGQYGGCSYDPIKTLEKIEALSQLDCVGSIFVPEGDLFSGAERKSVPKVSYRPMQTNDSYQVLFKGCALDTYAEPVIPDEPVPPAPTSRAQ